MLPGESGIDLVQRLLQEPVHGRRIPVAVFSAGLTPPVREQLLAFIPEGGSVSIGAFNGPIAQTITGAAQDVEERGADGPGAVAGGRVVVPALPGVLRAHRDDAAGDQCFREAIARAGAYLSRPGQAEGHDRQSAKSSLAPLLRYGPFALARP